jgi:uncharacterized ubiquitin-like protein YukD
MNAFDKKVNAFNKIFGDTYDLPIGKEFNCAGWHFNGGTTDEMLTLKIYSPISKYGNVMVEVVKVEVFGRKKSDLEKANKKWLGKKMKLPAHRVDTFIYGR